METESSPSFRPKESSVGRIGGRNAGTGCGANGEEATALCELAERLKAAAENLDYLCLVTGTTLNSCGEDEAAKAIEFYQWGKRIEAEALAGLERGRATAALSAAVAAEFEAASKIADMLMSHAGTEWAAELSQEAGRKAALHTICRLLGPILSGHGAKRLR